MVTEWILIILTFGIGFAFGYFRRHEEETIEKIKSVKIKEEHFGLVPDPTAEDERAKQNGEVEDVKMFDRLFGGKKK